MGRRWEAGWLIVALAACMLLAAPASQAFTPQQTAELQQLLELDQQQTGYPGEILGVWQRGNGGFVGTAGVSSLATGDPISVRDHFRIGSVTKTFTATLILRLVEQGKIRLSDHIDRFLRGIPGGHRVTVKRLLNQTSGFADLANGFSKTIELRNPHKQWSLRRLVVGSLRKRPRVCAPGRCWHYSNVNYLTLGMIAAKAGGGQLGRQFRRQIFDRLGLSGTDFAPSRPVPKPIGHGYLFNAANVPIDTSRWNFSWGSTAGGMTSTLRDLRRWCPAVATGRKLLSHRMQRKRLNFVDVSQETGVPGTGYGLGIFSLPTQAGVFLGHNGEVPGYDTLCLYSPQSGVTMVAFGTTSVELDPVSPDHIPVSMLFNLAPAIAQVIADG
jgi:D-alanyl-D-alanine carboxypeptidase